MIYLELFWTFFLIGAFTFGGGYAMLPLIQIEVVNKGWLANEAVVNFIAVSESTPGPFAINMATYVGSEMGGILGAACATLGVVMPSFIIILTVAKCYDRFKNSKLVKGAMSGLKPAVIGMIGTAVLSIGKTVFLSSGLWVSIGIFAVMAVLAFKKVHPIVIICLSAAAGIAAGCLGLI
jgi:chromate transporter